MTQPSDRAASAPVTMVPKAEQSETPYEHHLVKANASVVVAMLTICSAISFLLTGGEAGIYAVDGAGRLLDWILPLG